MTGKNVAILTIHDAGKMTPEGRKDVAKWIRGQAKWLEDYGDQMAARCTARYIYVADEKKEMA